MKNCWASALGNCEGGLTGEHLISNNLLAPRIQVQRFRWCRDEPKEIGSAAFVSNFLCKRHNEQLSPYDAEVKKFTSALESWAANIQKFDKYGFNLKKIPIVYKIDGYRLEKWFAKTLVNVSLVNAGEVKVDFDRLLPVLFGTENFTSPYGFYLTSEVVQTVDTSDFFELLHILNDTRDRELAGGLFPFKGFRFIMLLPNSVEPIIENERLKPLANSLTSHKVRDWSGLRVTWHHRSIAWEHLRVLKGQPTRRKFKTLEIKFEWD